MTIIGIDLGTTNSLVARLGEDGPELIPNIFGEYLTPSVVSMSDDGLIYVGKIAKERQLSAPDMTVANFKRTMGSLVTYTLGNRQFTSEELSSFVIKKLRQDAEVYLNRTVTEAVISTPAYFSDAQRKATKQAGELAGLKVERIISEPTAAAIAFGINQNKKDSRYMVFDLGGGTFDVSIIEYLGSIIEVHAVAGDNYLGGEDFNDVLATIFLEKHGIRPENLTLRELATLNASAESAKRAFSEQQTESVVMEWQFDNLLKTKITTKMLKDACADLLHRLKAPVLKAVHDSQISLSSLDNIVLVGGATKLPLVREFATDMFGRPPATNISPDKAVALGAAIQAAMKERHEAVAEIILTDVCPYTLGTKTSVVDNNGLIRNGIFVPIIERNTVIPASRVKRFYTLYDYQEALGVEILQGESRDASQNILLGKLVIPVPRAKAGEESIDIRYTYDVNGLLEVEVTVNSTNITKRMIIEREPGVLSSELIEERLQELAALKLHPREKDANRYLLERGSRLYQQSTGKLRERVGQALDDFESALDSQEPDKIERAANRLRQASQEVEDDQETRTIGLPGW
jgi:molecular chaperone HscC